MGVGKRALSALGKIGTALSVVLLFFLGLLGTIYLSLRTAEVKVPDLMGKDRFAAEAALSDAGLNIRIKGTRPSGKKPDTVLSQLPESGMVVKVGQTVAVEVSRQPKEGESVPSSEGEEAKPEGEKPQENANANANNTNQASNQNQNQNQNKPKNTNANKNKNANNSNNRNANNSNNRNANSSNNSNANRTNANRGNMNANRTANNGNRGANSNATPPGNANRGNNTNANRRPPIQTPPFNPGANRGTPQ